MIGPGALTKAANEHKRFEWRPDRQEWATLREWIEDNLIPSVYYNDPRGLEETPEALIAAVLGDAWEAFV